jgi:hypothetical protein
MFTICAKKKTYIMSNLSDMVKSSFFCESWLKVVCGLCGFLKVKELIGCKQVSWDKAFWSWGVDDFFVSKLFSMY